MDVRLNRQFLRQHLAQAAGDLPARHSGPIVDDFDCAHHSEPSKQCFQITFARLMSESECA